ncbi:GNAT family N-acetyltransferase [Nocardia vinacea]|uniref:GNAT family N-acetyltransferase n=1 Tax=Nocardia vinacea TaxID=96468 RepID=UPI00340030E0
MTESGWCAVRLRWTAESSLSALTAAPRLCRAANIVAYQALSSIQKYVRVRHRKEFRPLSEESGSVVVEIVRQVSDETLAALGVLLPQLSASASSLTRERLETVVAEPGTELLIARTEGAITGMLTLITYTIPTGLRARIEDVVVDHAVRGRGVGKALTATAIDIAGQRGARTVDLTSAPSKTAANKLYQNLGFTPRETTTYRITPTRPADSPDTTLAR